MAKEKENQISNGVLYVKKIKKISIEIKRM